LGRGRGFEVDGLELGVLSSGFRVGGEKGVEGVGGGAAPGSARQSALRPALGLRLQASECWLYGTLAARVSLRETLNIC
jgi:hypothetical protein